MKNKRLMVFIFTVFAFGLITFTVNWGVDNLNKWYGLIIGVGIMVSAIPFHLLGKHSRIGYITSFILNNLGVGLSISTYYSKYHLNPKVDEMVLASLIGLGILVFFGLISLLNLKKTYITGITVVLILFLFILSIILWIIYKEISYSLLFYYLNITYFYMVAMTKRYLDFKDFFRKISLFSFGTFIVISIIVLIIVSEGDALDGLDFGFSGERSKKRL